MYVPYIYARLYSCAVVFAKDCMLFLDVLNHVGWVVVVVLSGSVLWPGMATLPIIRLH